MIAAEKECTSRQDVKPDRVLRPIGTRFKEWIKCENTTTMPHWTTWKVVGYIESYKGRKGNTLLYERNEELKLA